MAQITAEQLDAIINEDSNVYTATWAGGEMLVKKYVDFRTVMEIIANVVESCFDEDGAYIPEVKDFVLWSYIVDKYTDLELPEDIELRANVFIKTDLVNAIRECVCVEQVSSIEDAIDKRIENSIAAGNNVLLNGVMNTYASLAAIHSEMENALEKIGGVNPAKLFNTDKTNTDEAES